MISDGHKQNLDTIIRAAMNGDLTVVECQSKETGQRVVVLCATYRVVGGTAIAPFAKMFDGNPFEELNPPDHEGGYVETN